MFEGSKSIFIGDIRGSDSYSGFTVVKSTAKSMAHLVKPLALKERYQNETTVASFSLPSTIGQRMHHEQRVFKGADTLLIMDGDRYFNMSLEERFMLKNSVLTKVKNRDYIDFDSYMSKRQGKPVTSLEMLKSMSKEMARDYYEAIQDYEASSESKPFLVESTVLQDEFIFINFNRPMQYVVSYHTNENFELVHCEVNVKEVEEKDEN